MRCFGWNALCVTLQTCLSFFFPASLCLCITSKRRAARQQKLSRLFQGRRRASQEMCLRLTGCSLFISEKKSSLRSEMEQSVPGANTKRKTQSSLLLFKCFSFQATLDQHCFMTLLYIHIYSPSTALSCRPADHSSS